MKGFKLENSLWFKKFLLLVVFSIHLKSQNVKNCTVEVFKEPKLSPLIFIEIESSTPDAGNILMYGHLDKQPHLTGWSEGLGPLDPVIRDIKPSLENTPYSFFQGLFSNRVLFTWKFFTSLGLIFYKLKRPLSELQNFFLAITEFASVFIFYPKTFSSKNSKKVYIQKWATPQTIQKKPSISEYGWISLHNMKKNIQREVIRSWYSAPVLYPRSISRKNGKK